MLRSSGPGQVLGSKVANRVLAIRLVQWLGWVFGTEERKKESTWQVKFDKLRLSSWLVTNNKKQHTIASGPPSNHLTSDSLSSQLVKSTWKVTPLKSHQQDFPRTPPKGYLVGGQVTVMAKKRSKSITFFFEKKFPVKMMFLELFCDVLHHGRPHCNLTVLLRRWWIICNNL